MRTPLILACLVLLTARPAVGADDNPNAPADAKRLRRELPGTWDCVSLADAPKQIAHIKHLTPTHYTWVTYDRDRNEILAISGGTWSLKDGKYEEVCEFASDTHQHLRGKTNLFAVNLAGDKWDLKGVPDSEIDVDEVWTRIKQGDLQKKNTGEPGRQLVGTWERGLGPRTPKALRMLKHVTPTHWTWVIYDRENRRVAAAMGGTWTLRDGEYVEDVQFATDNIEKAGEASHAYEFRIDGDRWILKSGPNVRLSEDETWTRLMKPNP
jgi:hypothetical protein